jgi:hypothetical protein
MTDPFSDPMDDDADREGRKQSRRTATEHMLTDLDICRKQLEANPNLTNKELAHRLAVTPKEAHRLRQLVTRKVR